MYTHVCDSVWECVFRPVSGDFPVPSCCQRVWQWSCFSRCSHHPVSLSLFYVYSLNFHFQRWELTFKLSMSCCLLPQSNASITAPPLLPRKRDNFYLQTTRYLTVTFPYLNTMQRWLRKENESKRQVKKKPYWTTHSCCLCKAKTKVT